MSATQIAALAYKSHFSTLKRGHAANRRYGTKVRGVTAATISLDNFALVRLNPPDPAADPNYLHLRCGQNIRASFFYIYLFTTVSRRI